MTDSLMDLTGTHRWRLAGLAVTWLAVAFACSDGTGAERPGLQTTGSGGNTAVGPGPTGIGGTVATAAGGSVGGTLIDPTTGAGGSAGRDTVCDDMGVCTCFNIGVLGRNGTYGAVPGQDTVAALEAWLDEKSSAAVDTHTTKPTIDEAFLSQYDVLILQALEAAAGSGQWAFTQDELAAFEAWVRGGGGVITLTGYSDQPAEAQPTNELLRFSGMSYAGLSGAGDTALQGSCPDTCCYCNGESIPTDNWSAHPIGLNVSAVGAFFGRSITAGAGEVVASTATGQVLGAAIQVDTGRVFMFHDEWVTYTSQWNGSGLTNTCLYNDPNNPCNDRHPTNDYQVPQFWYNAIKWASGDQECFDISEPEIIK